MKKKIIDYIEQLEAKALQTDDYFKQRNDLYIENQKLHNIIKEVRELADKYEMGKYDYSVPCFELKEILEKEEKE